jgi:hypothetical protein
MNKKHVLLLLIGELSALLVLSCSLPQGPGDQPAASAALAVTTDSSRNQGIYINENGLKTDILSYEEQDGRTVKCVEAIGIAAVGQSSSSSAMGLKGGSTVKGLIVGTRDDGSPGVWEIESDDSIHAVKIWKGGSSSRLPDSEDRDGAMRGLFGWKYFPIAVRTDGARSALIVGLAVNDGFKHGKRWNIEEGTTVGVYWKLLLGAHKHFVLVAPARVIGIGLDQAELRHWKPKPARGKDNLKLSSLNLFLLDYYEDYLVELKVTREDPDNQQVFYWDAKEAVYGVKGLNKSLDDALAKISLQDAITFAADESGNEGDYARLVIDTYEPHRSLPPYAAADTYLALYDAAGNLLAENNDGNTDLGQGGSSRIEVFGANSGRYFLKVTKGTDRIGPYAVRVLSLAVGAALPLYPDAFDILSDPYENKDAPEAVPPLSLMPAGIRVGTNNFGRILDPATDVDWILLDLPVVIDPYPKP